MIFDREELEEIGNLSREAEVEGGFARIPREAYPKILALAKKDPGFAEDLRVRAKVLRGARRVMAKYDSSTFAEYVLRTEGDGKPIRNAPVHDAMHDLCRERKRVVLWGSPTTGKSLQISVAYGLSELGKDPNMHICVIQATDTLAKKTIRTVGAYISDFHSPGYAALHEIYPRMVPSKRGDAVWNSHALTVERTATARDPSYQCCGLFGNILGSRLDLIIIDDILTFNNTRNPESRQRVVDWILTTVINRLDPEKGKLIFMGNAWHPDDAMHVFAEGRFEEAFESGLSNDNTVQRGVWASARFPIRDELGKTNWPDKWPQKVLDEHIKGLPPGEVARAFDCVAGSDATSRMKRIWFSQCKVAGAAGELTPGVPALMRQVRDEEDPRTFYCGVDLAFADISKKGDRCAISTIAVDSTGRVELINIRSGRWLIDELLGEIESAYNRWEPRYIFIESNAAQQVIGRMMRGELAALGLDFPQQLKRSIRQYETTAAKHHPKWGIEGIGVELAAKIWTIPSGNTGEVHPEIERWIQEMLHYSPDPKIHTGDRAMATYMAWDGMRRRLGANRVPFFDDPTLDNPIPAGDLTEPGVAEGLILPRTKRKKSIEEKLEDRRNMQPMADANPWDDLNDFLGGM